MVVSVCLSDLDEEHALGLQAQAHAVPLVVQEVLQAQELHAAHGAPVAPVHRDLQLPGLRPLKPIASRPIPYMANPK
jgi:hypothetical protein